VSSTSEKIEFVAFIEILVLSAVGLYGTARLSGLAAAGYALIAYWSLIAAGAVLRDFFRGEKK